MRSSRPRNGLRISALVGAALLLFVPPAGAFYWYGWPGSGVTPPPTVTTRPTTKLPTTPTPPTEPKPPDVPTEPQQIPEPATLLAVAIGLATAGVARRLRRRVAV